MSKIAATADKRRRRRARKAGLVYVNDFDSGITPSKSAGKKPSWVYESGRPVRSPAVLKRIESLVIPPAWNDVWICRAANGHIQAIGTDAAGRRQYVYHPGWSAISTAAKFDRLALIATLLPRIRRHVRRDLGGSEISKARVLAAVVRLLDKSHLRVGNRRYSEQRGSRGATTLLADNVKMDQFHVSLDYHGKSGKQRHVEFTDRKVAEVIGQCAEIHGQFLFSYVAGDGQAHATSSSDVNEYLREISGESITAKDFRTWWGSTIAVDELSDMESDLSETQRKRREVAAVKRTAAELGNTVAVCRGSYIHPGILVAAKSGELPELIRKAAAGPKSDRAEMTRGENLLTDLLPHLQFS